MKNNRNFVVRYNYALKTIRRIAKECEKDNHRQQVAYSTYEDALTQICFDCNEIRTTMREEGGEDTK